MKNQFLVDTIYNHEYLKNFLALLKSIKKNNKLEYIAELCEQNEIEEDDEMFQVFLNELNNVCKSCNNKEIEKKSNDITLYEDLKDMNSSFSNNSEEINDFEIESNISTHEKNKVTRIYVDGIFDLSHSGHFNAMRQAKKLGDIVVVGINSDEDALKSKGVMPIYTQEERGALIGGCKWVDEVIIGTKYNVNMELLEKYNCDYAAHGSDLVCDRNGNFCYEEVKKNNKLKIFERSYGISSTTIINHLLQAVNSNKTTCSDTNNVLSNEIKDKNSVNDINALSTSNTSNTNDSHCKNINSTNSDKNNFNKKILDSSDLEEEKNNVDEEDNKIKSCENILSSKYNVNRNRCYLTTSLLYQFIDNNEKKKKKKVVYVDGSFDIFHIGHLKILENAKKLGDFLLVGMHDDDVVRRMKGKYFPVVTLLERTLNVLAMRVVDDVVIGAPWIITESFIKRFHIDVVVRGTIVDYIYSNNEIDPYAVPKKLNIYKELSSQSNITTFEIIERIEKNKKYLMNNMSKRSKKEENIWKVSNSYILT
ncbi:ethanolamine-phosphate cytidylyltransferase, putative [Plasmodium gallinaceum]|uniref:ethanolamine-phosphate cytidylyltransferase n=1 Tax=Plasmodium gallinaceum TaxID=5849 RepID=A0A1J1GSC5_PLAGA|nr:ethanolamine-phosphate cytidylyltransferase, putative [Plasmodium gallinaceum]CRG95183.1 ethanolamine-phosphate cytidylyltransferase, putative [Plasmodium gallinaceum]